jgi:DNA-binding transcriptional LysR family regulator
VRPIVHDHLVLVLPADHPLTALHRVHLADLADQSLVLFPRRSSPSYFDQITSACRAAGFSPRVDFEVSSVVSQIAYVGCGLGIGMVPSRSMRFGGSDVVFRPLVETINVVSIAAAFDPQRHKDLVPDIIASATEIGAGSSALPIRRPEPVLEEAGVP